VSSRPLSALPSPAARAVAFVAICVAGAAGGVIGHAVIDLQCADECTGGRAFGLVTGAWGMALGMAVVAVLVLRALGEWRELGDAERTR